jgi:two-component system cell cycle response regulator
MPLPESVLTTSRAGAVVTAESGALSTQPRTQASDAASLPVGPNGTPARRRDRVVLLALAGPQQGSVFTLLPPIAAIGREEGVAVLLRDDSVSARHARISHGPEGTWIEDLGSRNGTFVNDQRVVTPRPLLDGDHVRFGSATLVRFWMMDELEEQALATLFALTLRDPLTRLYNRRYFDERLSSEFHFAHRHRAELALLLIDVDHFKSINDDCGHQMGDAVLRLVAGSIERVMRPEDVVARFGGDEFAIIARATSERNAEIFAARICRRIEALTAEPPNHLLHITVSAGVALMTRAHFINGAS